MDLKDICKTLHFKATKYIFVSSEHITFSRRDVGHKTSFNKFKKIEIISRIFSNHT